MFNQSFHQPDNTGVPINCFVEGGQVRVRKSASHTPHNLKERIESGEDIVSIWFDFENASLLDGLTKNIGFSIAPIKDEKRKYSLPSTHQMTADDIFDFCKFLSVHPAHLVPFNADPRLSLPLPLLELLIQISKGERSQSDESISLAKVAISFESKRINVLLSNIPKKGASPQSDDYDFEGLTKVFNDVLGDPKELKRLVRESEGVHAVLKGKAYVHYPLATRVRNVALSSVLQSELIQSKNSESNRAHLLQFAFDAVRSEYQCVWKSRKISDMDLLLFIADVKDALLDNDIEPRAATMENIAKVISQLDLSHTQLEMSYSYYKIRFGTQHSLQKSSQELLNHLVENIALYFQYEDKLSSAKRKTHRASDKFESEENRINSLFVNPAFKDGTLLHRLMDSYVVIALAERNEYPHHQISPS